MSVDTGSDVEMEHADVEAAGSADVPATVQPAPSAQHPAQATAASAFPAYGAPLGALPPAEAVLLANQPVLVFVAGPLAHELLQGIVQAVCTGAWAGRHPGLAGGADHPADAGQPAQPPVRQR